MKKNYELLIYFFVVVIIGLILLGIAKERRNDIYALGDIVETQKHVDEQISKFMNDKSYTLNNPKVIVNPYKLTPLTAIVLFNTKEETSIKVTINGKFTTTVESTKSHAIPIYGLYAGTDNTVLLEDDKGNTKELTIKTEDYEGDKLKVEYADESLNDQVYFLSPNFVENCIYDKEGNLLWYIKGDYAGDIVYLENGHFLISDPYQGTNGVKINYAGFLEMDYLGKIYTQYITPYGYHHEIILLDENRILTTGAKDGSPFLEAVLYIMDRNTGEELYSVDFYDYFHNIAPSWVDSLGTNFDFVLNSISYDEKNNDAIISFRGFGAIVRFDLDTKEIIWMFADPENMPSEFDKYLLKVTDNTKYPYGEHSAVLLSDGTIAFHNNDADQFHMDSSDLSFYKDRYTTNVIFEVDENNKTLHTIWEYDANKNEWSKVAGRIEILPNNNKLITFGWSISDDSYESIDGVSINDTNYLKGIIVELDQNDKVLFKGTTKGLLYRVYKIDLFDETTKNYEVKSYNKIDGTKFTGEVVPTNEIKPKLKKASKFTNSFDVQINRVMTDLPMGTEDNVDILFVGPDNTYIYNYTKSGEEVYSGFNSNKYGIKVHLDSGKYQVFIKLNDTYYDTKVNVIF